MFNIYQNFKNKSVLGFRREGVCTESLMIKICVARAFVYIKQRGQKKSFRLSISNAKGWRPKTASYISNPVCFEGLNVGPRWKIRFYSTRGRSIDCFRLEDCKEELPRTFLIILLGSVVFFIYFKSKVECISILSRWSNCACGRTPE